MNLRLSYSKTFLVFLICTLFISCTIIPKTNQDIPQSNKDNKPAKSEETHRKVTFWRTCGYTFLGMPRDILDLPFTVINRGFYFLTPDEFGLLGFRVSHNVDHESAIFITAKILNALVGSFAWGMIWGEIASRNFEDTSYRWAIGIVGAGAMLIYPITVAPLEDILFRYPHNKEMGSNRYTNFGVGYRKLKENPHYKYFPNIDLFFPKESEKNIK